MIDIVKKSDCCGCNACGDVCPKNAVSFQTDNEGFWYPSVDKGKCINCGLCDNVCPVKNISEIKKNDFEQPKSFGGYSKNIAVRFDSTSGGAFSCLASEMYRQNGFVSGAVYTNDFNVVNYISNNKRDLSKLRSSKYLQSNASGLYRKIKELLDSDEKVLACGAPCQMAALKCYLKKDYDNLIIVDFICRATNSPLVYHKYLESLEKRYNSKIVSVKAKNKDYGWRSLARKIVFENGEVYYGLLMEDDYRRGYHLNVYERPSCYDCKFKGFLRISDITLGDFWGIEKVDPSIDKDLGTSLILINSKKGEQYFNKVMPKMVAKPFPLEKAIAGNTEPLLGKIAYPKNINREAFFADLEKLPFDECAKKYFPYQPPKMTAKKKIRKFLSIVKFLFKSPSDFLRSFFFNMRHNVESKMLSGDYARILSHCALDISKSSRLRFKGVVTIGQKRNKKSKAETRILVEDGAIFEILGNNHISYNSDIQVFRNATLHFGEGAMNSGLQIVCAEKIWIGDRTRIGRDVWIRDNNGGHTVIETGYKNSSPVIIGNGVWICSNVNILKGVTIGDGAVIAANSVVTQNIPPHCMAQGNPAKVIAEGIVWSP